MCAETRKRKALQGCAKSGVSAAVSSEGEKRDCCVCLESLKECHKKFAILDCDHVICMDCASAWKHHQSSVASTAALQEAAFQGVAVRSPKKQQGVKCPLCRHRTTFVVASFRFVVGEDKRRLLESKKSYLKTLPCIYETRENCHRSDCLYAHIEPPKQVWSWGNGIDHALAQKALH